MATYDITALDSALNFDVGNGSWERYTEKLSDTRVLVAWRNGYGSKQVQTFELNRTTGVLTANSTPYEFETDTSAWTANPPSITVLDDTHFVIVWTGDFADGFCQTFQVDAGTGAVTSWGTVLEFDPLNGVDNSSVLMANDGTNARILNVWRTASIEGSAIILTVTMSTGAISAGTQFVFDTGLAFYQSLAKISDTKAIVTYGGTASDGYAVVLDINTTTWTISNAGSLFEWLPSSTVNQNSLAIMSESPLVAINAFENSSNFGLRPLSINDSTWAITNLGSATTGIASVAQTNQKRILFRIDDEHLIVFYKGDGNDGFVRTYSFNNSTGALTLIDELEFDTSEGAYQSACDMGEGLFVNSWDRGAANYIQAFQVTMPSTFTASPLMHHMAITGGLM